MKRALLPISACCLALALASCGDDDDQTTAAGSTETSPSSTTTATAAQGQPSGELTADGVGAITVGSSAEEMKAAFGAPTTKEEFASGCEADPGAAPSVQYSYTFDDGRLAISFNADTGEMTTYLTDSAHFATEHGDRVGDDWEKLTESWGAALDPIVLGTEKPSPESGVYKVGLDGENQLVFDLADRTVTRISGGEIQVCE